MAVPLCQSGGCERDRREAKEQQHLCLGTSCDKGVDLDKNRSSYIARALVYSKQCLGTFVRKNVHGKQALMLTARLPIVANLACSRMEDCCYEPSIDSDEYLHHCKENCWRCHLGRQHSVNAGLCDAHRQKSLLYRNHTQFQCATQAMSPLPTVSSI